MTQSLIAFMAPPAEIMKPRRRNATERLICGGGRCKRRRRRDARGPHFGADVSWAICAPWLGVWQQVCRGGQIASSCSIGQVIVHRYLDRATPPPGGAVARGLPELLGTYFAKFKPVLEIRSPQGGADAPLTLCELTWTTGGRPLLRTE